MFCQTVRTYYLSDFKTSNNSSIIILFRGILRYIVKKVQRRYHLINGMQNTLK